MDYKKLSCHQLIVTSILFNSLILDENMSFCNFYVSEILKVSLWCFYTPFGHFQNDSELEYPVYYKVLNVKY